MTRVDIPRVQVLSPATYAARAAKAIADALRASVLERGSCALALAGGNTPRPVYASLAGYTALPWTATQVYFGDERAVAPNDPESNYTMATTTLLRHVPVRPSHVHRMPAERPDREAAAVAYQIALAEPLDVLLLGMGRDGHIASLFPGSPALDERERSVVPVQAPVAPVSRLTVTPRVVEAARRVIVLVTGEAKAGAVRTALATDAPPAVCPARLVADATWLLDEAAASELRVHATGARVP